MVPAMPTKTPQRTRKQIGARVNQELITEVRVLALRRGRPFNELIEEALKDLLKKYREKRV